MAAAKKRAAAEEKAKKKGKSGDDVVVKIPDEMPEEPTGVNKKTIIIAAVVCVLVIVASFVLSKMFFGGSGVSGMSGAEQAENVKTELTGALQSATAGIHFSVSGGKLTVANDSDYVVFFKEGYSLYKATGTYSMSDMSNSEKLAEAKKASVSTDNAELISSALTSYFVNTKDLADKTVTLNARITDDNGDETVINQTVSVKVEYTATIVEDETTGTEGDTTGGETGTEENAGGETGAEDGTAEDGTAVEDESAGTEGETEEGTDGGELAEGQVALTGSYNAYIGVIIDGIDSFTDYRTAVANGEEYAGAVSVNATGTHTLTLEKGSELVAGQVHVLVAEIDNIFDADYTSAQIVISNVKLYLDDVEVAIAQDKVMVNEYTEGEYHTLRITLFNEYGGVMGEDAAVDATTLACANGKISISFDLALAE